MGDLADQLGVERIVMEATSDYRRPPFYLIKAHDLDLWLVKPRDLKHFPARPNADRLDAVWLCKVAEGADGPCELRPASRHSPAVGHGP